MEPTQLAIGQYICVPKTTPSKPTCPEGECCIEPEPAPDCNMLRRAQNACSATDTVQCGQTLADILTKYGMSFAEFSYLNPTLVYSGTSAGAEVSVSAEGLQLLRERTLPRAVRRYHRENRRRPWHHSFGAAPAQPEPHAV